ncbi:hypothetical protein SISSUDRAFT_404164 [Sistotremastrum suecicum HHB10207 ss-3]|uniref:Uncharacterized protein n=1 Tax=Sistotremastrum suecicum HHB10207 ss-3 TaxID=1314776 RepID=A0A166FTS7_9AGAM|nr:hypothetical protein SISSUDRAFT_404164 [Sistotremastrum suecicum HHB10207 ss-3]
MMVETLDSLRSDCGLSRSSFGTRWFCPSVLTRSEYCTFLQRISWRSNVSLLYASQLSCAFSLSVAIGLLIDSSTALATLCVDVSAKIS